MKTKLKRTTSLLLALIASPLVFAAEGQDPHHGHSHKHDGHNAIVKGPNGGHVVKSKAGFSFEVTADKDRKARIVFLDRENKVVALGAQNVTGIAGPRSAPARLAFAKGAGKDADVLISQSPLPAGAHVQMILTIMTTPDAKSVTERFELHLH